MTAVSVIVPIYNTEDYLEQCLNSLIGQTFDDLEIICILDGPTDGSGLIARRYAQQDARIVIIEQPNSGIGVARNIGLSRATGEYISFVDSDDWVDPEFIEKLYSAARSDEAGMVICQFYNYRNQPIPSRSKPAGIYDAEEICRELIMDKFIRNYCWNKLIQKEIFTKHQIFFPAGMVFEDIAIMPRVAHFSRKVVVIDECLYYYRQRSNSLTCTYQKKTFMDLFMALEMNKTFLQEYDLYPLYRAEFEQCCMERLIDSTITICRQCPRLMGLIDELEVKYFELIENPNDILPLTQERLSTHSRIAYRMLFFNRQLFALFASRKWI